MQRTLKELLQDLEQELLRLGYVEGTMSFYRRRWLKLLKFAEERGATYFSEQLGLDFLESQFHILRKDKTPVNVMQWRANLAKVSGVTVWRVLWHA